MAWFWWLLVLGVITMWVLTLVDLVRRRHSMSGGKLAAWVILVIVFPVLGTVVYFLVNGTAGAAARSAGGDAYSQDPRLGA
jgi:hypothetical protein